MSDFKAKMHQIQFPDPLRTPYGAPPDPLAAFKGPSSKGRDGVMKFGVVVLHLNTHRLTESDF